MQKEVLLNIHYTQPSVEEMFYFITLIDMLIYIWESVCAVMFVPSTVCAVDVIGIMPDWYSLEEIKLEYHAK